MSDFLGGNRSCLNAWDAADWAGLPILIVGTLLGIDHGDRLVDLVDEILGHVADATRVDGFLVLAQALLDAEQDRLLAAAGLGALAVSTRIADFDLLVVAEELGDLLLGLTDVLAPVLEDLIALALDELVAA